MKFTHTNFRLKTLFITFNFSFVSILFIVWFSFESIRVSKNLWILFFYSFPSQFLISVVPHEPVFLYFSKFHFPLVVTLVATVGALLTETINYSTIKYFSEFRTIQKIRKNRLFDKVVTHFKKAPFAAILVVGFAPLPFYPIRFLVVMSDYPLLKFILAVFLSRTPRYIILAYLCKVTDIPDFILVVIFLGFGIVFGIQLIKNKARKD